MYRFTQKTLIEKESVKYMIFNDGRPLRYSQFINLLHDDKSFRSFFIDLLSDVPFHAYQWETPAVTNATLNQPFEFVITNSPGIDIPPDAEPFASYLNEGDNEPAVFDNLGKDATLIVPALPDEDLNYSHLAVFIQHAPKEQQHQLWKKVGKVTQQQISTEPIWLNTAGGGVAWLHIRLDSRPKYYRHQAYITI
jgi:hypothetical protein